MLLLCITNIITSRACAYAYELYMAFVGDMPCVPMSYTYMARMAWQKNLRARDRSTLTLARRLRLPASRSASPWTPRHNNNNDKDNNKFSTIDIITIIIVINHNLDAHVLALQLLAQGLQHVATGGHQYLTYYIYIYIYICMYV